MDKKTEYDPKCEYQLLYDEVIINSIELPKEIIFFEKPLKHEIKKGVFKTYSHTNLCTSLSETGMGTKTFKICKIRFKYDKSITEIIDIQKLRAGFIKIIVMGVMDIIMFVLPLKWFMFEQQNEYIHNIPIPIHINPYEKVKISLNFDKQIILNTIKNKSFGICLEGFMIKSNL